MAERVIAVKMQIDGGESIKELETISEAIGSIEDELKNLDQESAKSTAAESFRELNKIVEENVLSMGDLGMAAEQYKNIAIAAGTKSPIGKKALESAALMEREMNDLNESVSALSERGGAITGALTIGQGAIASFGTFQGIQAALGIENEALEKTFVKLTGVMTALQSIQELQVIWQKRSVIQAQAQVVWTKAQALWTNVLTVAQKLLNKAMKNNPVGWLIAGIMLLVGAIAALGSIFGDVGDAIDEFFQGWLKWFGIIEETEAETRNKQIAREKGLADAHNKRMEQIESEKDSIIDASKKKVSALELEKDTLEANGKSSAAVTIQIMEEELKQVQAILEANAQKIASARKYYEDLAIMRGESEEDFKQSMKNQGIDLDELDKKSQDLIESNETTIKFAQNKITKFKREQYEKDLQNKKDVDAKWLKAEELKWDDAGMQFSDYLKLNEENAIEFSENIDPFDFLDDEELDIQMEETLGKFETFTKQVEAFFQTGSENIKEELKAVLEGVMVGVDTAMEIFAETNALLDQLGENRMQENEDRADAQISSLENQKKQELKAENLSARDKALIDQKYAQKEYETKLALAKANDKIAKNQFNRDKALGIADAVINTAKGVLKALGTYGPTPIGIAAMSAAGAIGALQIATISATKFRGTAANISPPQIDIPSADEGGAGGGGSSDQQGDGIQDNVGTSTSETPNLTVSIVEIEKVASQVSEVDDISTIG